MSLTRRRFMALVASIAMPGAAGAVSREVWRGRAFGGDVSLDLTGPRDRVAADLVRLTARMREIEARFTLYEDDGPLVRLNRTGKGPLHGDLRRVMEVSRRVHVATNGMFDPTVQSLWGALAEGRGADLSAVGLDRVRMTDTEITLADGQALTFNGIAQGYAADALRAMLSGWGYSTALVDMGEQAALGGPFRLGLVDPAAGRIGQVTLTGQAAATSSPAAMTNGGRAHILHPKGGRALWSTVTVIAASATLSDAASTAFCLMERDAIRQAKEALGLSDVLLVDSGGDLSRL